MFNEWDLVEVTAEQLRTAIAELKEYRGKLQWGVERNKKELADLNASLKDLEWALERTEDELKRRRNENDNARVG